MDDAVYLEEGKLVLFTRNGIWQARIPVGDGRYLWRSLKTSDRAKAQRDGTRLFHQTQFRLEEGLPVQQRTLNSVIDEYVAMRERDNAVGKAAKRVTSTKHTQDGNLRQIKRVAKFWREYAGAKPIDAIDNRTLSDFVEWRRTYYHGKATLPKNAQLDPTDKTIQWDVTLGKMLLKFAQEQGYRGAKPLPDFSYAPKVKRVRPAPTLDEFSRMWHQLKIYHGNCDTVRQEASRWLLLNYVATLALSGLRVGEANSLRVRDVVAISDTDGRTNVQLHVRGKTGERVVVPHLEVKEILDAVLERKGAVEPDTLVFSMPDGSRIITLADQFNAFLKSIKLTHSSSGAKFTLYSLRHFYAVRAISKGIGVFMVARNMGTSVQVIEQVLWEACDIDRTRKAARR